MCKCTPEIRTPYCGAVGCEWPKDDGVKATNLVKLEAKSDVKEVLQEMLDMSDSLSCVMAVGLTKESTQILRGSTMSGLEKAYIVSFMNAWMANLFNIGEDN